ncbi:hypothetical protein ACJW30_10G067900 [Castanea mollissima]
MATFMVNVDGEKVKTTVTNRASSVDGFITELILSCNYSNRWPPIIGLDIELNDLNDSTKCKAATLQLCSGSLVPLSLINFLSAPLFCFVGVGIHKLLSFLRRDYGLECRNVPLSVIRGYWGAGNLNMEQIESAATDAFIFFKFGNMLFA